MKVGALLIAILAGAFFAAALISTEQQSMQDLVGTTWELSHIQTADGTVLGVDRVEELLVFPDRGPNRLLFVTGCAETNVVYTPNGLGGDVVAATMTPTDGCSLQLMVNIWSLATRFWIELGEDTLTLQAQFRPEANVPDGLERVYTLRSSASAG